MSLKTNQLKSFYNTENPVISYCTKHSVKMTDVQRKLHEYTLENVSHGGMIGAPEAIQLNMNLMKLNKAKKVLDIGVFTGYSALSAALAVPEDGKVVALDVSDEYASIGKQFWKEAKVDHKIELIIQPALQTLDDLIKNGNSGTFDFAFIDADKMNYRNYYERCLTLIRPGGIISIDNVLWGGRVLEESKDESTKAICELNDFIPTDKRVTSNMLMVGDGLFLCFKL